jgi:16S rRNA (adenine1518-N6/adenine1519-N6)-dimethyltransferase
VTEQPAGPPWEDPRRVLRRAGLRPKRRYSQNFLVSRHAVERIAEAALELPGGRLIELGPGLGTLTAALLRLGAPVLAVEHDAELLQFLHTELAGYDCELVGGDAAELDYSALAARLGTPLRVVGNLPYAITGAILRGLVEARPLVSGAVVMVQREVAHRLRAAPASADYGALSVFVQAAFACEPVLNVPAGAFHPPPKVDSAVVRLRALDPPRAVERESFRNVVHHAFQGRRKTLKRALAALAPPDRLLAALHSAGIDPGLRGETLDVERFDALARALEAGQEPTPPSPAAPPAPHSPSSR